MKYTVAIRTLGTAGNKYQRELDSLMAQTMPPEEIIVYIAEGYPLPKETCGKERYVYVKKGMVAQRALPYNEVKTEWMLMLDDDVYLPPKGVEKLFEAIMKHKADVVSPNTFDHKNMGKATKLLNILMYKIRPFKSETLAYKVLKSGGFAYNNNPTKDFYWSETNAGPCLLCRKHDFLNIHFDEDLWLDDSPYALPDDQVMFYKMYISGLRVGTVFNSGIQHLDARTTISNSSEKEQKILYSEYRNLNIFWHKYIKPYNHGFNALKALLAFKQYKCIRNLLAIKNFITGNSDYLQSLRKASRDAKRYIKV